jgi:hypothetical protein
MGGQSRGRVRGGAEPSTDLLVANSECVDWEESSCRGDECIVQISNSMDWPASFSVVQTHFIKLLTSFAVIFAFPLF